MNSVCLFAQNEEVMQNEVLIQENRLGGISASQSSRNIVIIDKQQIRFMPVQSLQEMFTYIAGMDMRQRGTNGVQSDVSLMGGTFDQCLVLINGIKMYDPQTGHHNFNLPIDIAQIERIEILKGPAARIFGANALTGAINIIIQKVTKTGVYVNTVGGTSFTKDSATQKMYYTNQNRVRAQFAAKEQEHALQLTYNNSNGYRYNTANQQFTGTYLGTLGNEKTGTFQLIASYLQNTFGANGFYAAPYDKEATEKVNTALAGVAYNKKVGNWHFMPRVYWRNNVDDYIFKRDNPDYYHNHHITNVIGAEFHTRYTLKKGVLGLGIDARNEKIESNNLKNHTRINTGFFVEYRAFLPKNIILNIGNYTNFNSDFGVQFYPGADVSLPINDNFKAFANIGTANRLPTYTDLYYKGPSNIGNENLKPEKSWMYEGGLKYTKDNFSGQISGFRRTVYDFIDWVRASDTLPWQPQNFQRIYTNGAEISANYINKENRQNAFGLERINLGYTFLNANIQSGSAISKYTLENLHHQMAINLTYKAFSHFYPALSARVFQRLNGSVYSLVDAKVSYFSKYVDVFVDATNLFNTQYKEIGIIPNQGLWLRLGLTFRWEKS